MAQKKKLQVFVSSTYDDLKEERQAAVEAILTAGHIPAGMELFAAGDESQMNAIRRWIDESDVYLLILGGRYGSIEPKSQKSYIHLEYEYAIEKGKPFFAVVIDDDYLEEKVKKEGTKVFERDNPQQLKEFRNQVLTKLVRFWSEPRDIKLAILETMSEFSRRDDLIGWIPGDEGVKASTLTEEISRLAKENASLREQIAKSPATLVSTMYDGMTFDEMRSLLSNESIEWDDISESTARRNIQNAVESLGHDHPTLLAFLLAMGEMLSDDKLYDGNLRKVVKKLRNFGMVENGEIRTGIRGETSMHISESGRQFLLRLRMHSRQPDVINGQDKTSS